MVKTFVLSGICYFSFGFICILGNFIFIPIILLGLHKSLKVQYFCRDLVRLAWGVFLKIGEKSGKIKAKFTDTNTNFNSCLIIANHPSLLDVVYMLVHLKHVNCVVKSSLKRNIFLFGAIKASGYISNENEEKLLEFCLNTLKSGQNLLIFPEGTRTKDSINFHKAAFYIAIKAAKSIRAYTIKMDKRALKKDHVWYKTPDIRYDFNLALKLDIKDFYADLPDPIRVRKLHSFLENFYKEQQ